MGVVWRAQDAVLGHSLAVTEVGFPPTMAPAEHRGRPRPGHAGGQGGTFG
jgi:hypothetical protein